MRHKARRRRRREHENILAPSSHVHSPESKIGGQPHDAQEQESEDVAMVPNGAAGFQMQPVMSAPDISMKGQEGEQEEKVQMKSKDEEQRVQMQADDEEKVQAKPEEDDKVQMSSEEEDKT